MTEIKCFQDLEHIVANIEVVEALVKFAEISITGIDEFSDNGWRLSERVTNNINKVDNVDTVLQGLQNLNFASDFVLFNYRLTQLLIRFLHRKTEFVLGYKKLTRFENFDYDALIR